MIDIKQGYLTLLNTRRPTVTLVTFMFPSAEKLEGNLGLVLKLQTLEPSKNLCLNHKNLNHICIHLFGLNATKGQSISKGLFDILNSPKKRTNKFDFATMI